MPQIGWFELLIIVVVAVLVIGPKEFPIVLKKIGSWIRTVKSYFSEVQSNLNQITDIEEDQKKSKDLKKEKNPNEQWAKR